MASKKERKRRNMVRKQEQKKRRDFSRHDPLWFHRKKTFDETYQQLVQLGIHQSSVGVSILSLLNKYLDEGITYRNHRIDYGVYKGYYRYFLISLYNNPDKMDIVVLKTDTDKGT